MAVDLPTGMLRDVFGLSASVPIERELLGEWDGGRVEHAAWTDPGSGTPRRACLKYGDRTSLCRESLMYAALLDPPTDPVPEVLGCRSFADSWLIALGWVEGRRPDFSDAADVSRVSEALGGWLGAWSLRLEASADADGLCKRPVDSVLRLELETLWADRRDVAELCRRGTETARAALNHGSAVREAGGAELLEALHRSVARAPELAERIGAMPETLDWGDFSENNVILNSAGQGVTFLDLEFAALRPVPLVLDCLSEAYGTVPPGVLRDLAVERFAAGWNRTEGQPLPVGAFRASVRAAWVMYKISQFDDWLKRWTEGDRTEELKTWIQSTTDATLEVLAELDHA